MTGPRNLQIEHRGLMEFKCFGGQLPGPHLLITAGVHGDEYLPMLAVRELCRRLTSDPQLACGLRGTLTLIPVVNHSAFVRGHRLGEDGLDLARTCPGRADGSLTERVACELSQHIAAADYYVDLHTGGTELCVAPLAGYMLHPEKKILEQQRRLAKAFQLPCVWGTSAELHGRSLSVARDAGVPAIYVEYLGAHRELSEVARGGVQAEAGEHPLVAGCLNVMRHLHMLDGAEVSGQCQEIVEDWRPGSGHMQVCHPAPESGFLTVRAALGQSVSAGEVLAEITSVTEQTTHSVLAQHKGTVVVLREYPRINQGDSVAVIAENHEAT